FFSSRRRHTRSTRDWSSDVCSSDLTAARAGVASLEHMSGVVEAAARNPAPYFRAHDLFLAGWTLEEEGWAALDSATLARTARARSEERRVGKEGASRWWQQECDNRE